jgi:hypothetical protein
MIVTLGQSVYFRITNSAVRGEIAAGSLFVFIRTGGLVSVCRS